MNNIILFATYWNAIDWINPSLNQIDLINPIETIICDGCFDHRYPVHSSDGTREIIEDYVASRPHARLISPVRVPKLLGLLKIWQGNRHLPWHRKLYPARLKSVVRATLCHHYRINQALTFNKMINLSDKWAPGRWFMNYDCDQFYSTEVLDKFQETNTENEYGQLTADELTFFSNEKEFTDEYEKRNFNNMPHKIYSDTSIVTTRDIVRESLLKLQYYKNCVEAKHTGHYFHYKFTDSERFDLGYQVGDRVMPDAKEYKFKTFHGTHPDAVSKKFTNV